MSSRPGVWRRQISHEESSCPGLIGFGGLSDGCCAQARADGNNARVWGGMHYPSTVVVSDAVGEAIANYVNLNAMLRIHDRHER